MDSQEQGEDRNWGIRHGAGVLLIASKISFIDFAVKIIQHFGRQQLARPLTVGRAQGVRISFPVGSSRA